MSDRRRVERAESAGGVVYRTTNGEVEIVVCGRDSPPVWGLAKGTPDAGETREQTALREVREETGLEVRLEGFVDSITYWFAIPAGVRYQKTVYFYLMTPTGGDISLHDSEYDTVTWLPAAEALKSLSYENEVRVVRKGLSMVSAKTGIE